MPFENPPLLPQIDLDAVTNNGPTTLPSTDQQLVESEVGSAVNSSYMSSLYNNLAADLADSPIRYNNAADYFNKTLDALSNPASFTPDNKLLTPDEFNDKYWQPGMPKQSVPIYEQSAQIISQRQIEENKRQSEIQNANLGFWQNKGAGLATSALNMLDPIQDAMYLTPLVGEEAALAKVATIAGKGLVARTSIAGLRVATELTRGSVEGNIFDYTISHPTGQNKSLDEYVQEDLENAATAGAFALGLKGLFGAMGRGSKFFGNLDAQTQDHLQGALGSDEPASQNTVLDLDKNINEVESQLGGAKNSIEDRATLMSKEPVTNIAKPDFTEPLDVLNKVDSEAIPYDENVNPRSSEEALDKFAAIPEVSRLMDALDKMDAVGDVTDGGPNMGQARQLSAINRSLQPFDITSGIAQAVQAAHDISFDPKMKVEERNKAIDQIKEFANQISNLSKTLPDARSARDVKSQYRPATATELRAAGRDAEAKQVENVGRQQQNDRAIDVKKMVDSGVTKPKADPINPVVKELVPDGATVTEQAANVNKQLTGALQGQADIIKRLENEDPENPEKNAREIEKMEEATASGDEEISRVSKQKELMETAINCALNNGL